jgi:hypothetical protein
VKKVDDPIIGDWEVQTTANGYRYRFAFNLVMDDNSNHCCWTLWMASKDDPTKRVKKLALESATKSSHGVVVAKGNVLLNEEL